MSTPESTAKIKYPVNHLAPRVSAEDSFSKDWWEGLFTTPEKAIAAIRKNRKGKQVHIHAGQFLLKHDDQELGIQTSETIPVSFDVACEYLKKIMRPSLLEKGLSIKVTVCSNCIFLG